MTDLEKFTSLYKSVGIELAPIDSKISGKKVKILSLREGDEDVITGESLFVTNIIFDENGKFKNQEIKQ